MKSERSGCLSVLGKFASLFAVREYKLPPTHMVRTKTGVTVEVPDDVGNDKDYADVIAQTFRTGKATIGSYNESTGKFEVQQVDYPKKNHANSRKSSKNPID